MKKILVAFDGLHFSEGALQFAKKLNDIKPVLLTGAFLPQVDYANLWSYSGGGSSGSNFIPLVEDADAEKVQENVRRFESFCRHNKIRFRTHKEYFDFTLPELKKETRFADLLILSSESFYEQAGTDGPNEYLKDALHDVECPVVVIPEKFEFPEINILSYDGSRSSVYAIKQFAYLFPELANNKTILFYANGKSITEEIADEQNLKELTTLRYPTISFELGTVPEKSFSAWLSQNKNAMLVCGAFGRSEFSMMFKKSFINDVIREHRIPVFIAHK